MQIYFPFYFVKGSILYRRRQWHPAWDQPRLIQGIRRRDGVGEDQDTIASIRY